MTVDKICDVVSTYDLVLTGENTLPPNQRVQLKYTINIAQKAVCGIVIQEVPVEGELFFVNDTTFEHRYEPVYFALGQTAHLKLTTKGLAPIESVAVDWLK